jgi:hypothetical protein
MHSVLQGSGWVYYHTSLIRWSEPRLDWNTEDPFTRIKRAIEQADMAKACGHSFGYFEMTSLRCVPDLKRDPSRDRLSICFGRTWPRVSQ